MPNEPAFLKVGEYVINPAAIAYVKFPAEEHDRAHVYFTVPQGSDGRIDPRHITLRAGAVSKLWRYLTGRTEDLDGPAYSTPQAEGRPQSPTA